MTDARQTTFSGISLANAKKIVSYEFGEFLMKIQADSKSQVFEIHITDHVDKKTVEKFKAYWKNSFIVKVYSLKYEL